MNPLLNRAILLSSALFLSVSFILEYGVGLAPCPLCLMQRFCLAIITLSMAVFMIVRHEKWRRFFYVFSMLFIITGLYFASRHVWITLSPDNAHSCLPALSFMVENQFPASEIIKALFLGSADCAKVDWTFLGLSLPMWSLVGFIWLTMLAIASLYTAHKHKRE